MGNQGKHAAKYVRCKIILVNCKLSNICELKTYDSRKKTLLIKFEECSYVRKRTIIIFFVFHAFVNKTDGKIYRQTMENKNLNCTLFNTATFLKFNWGSFLQSPDNFSGPVSYFMCAMFILKIKVLLVLKAKQ